MKTNSFLSFADSRMENSEASYLENMECPVCLDVLRPPVRLCKNRHSTCHDCHHQIVRTSQTARCPLCREEFAPDSCPVKEQLYLAMKVTCKFDGCTVKGFGREVIRHERRCTFRVRRCPNCPWEGPQPLLTPHYLINHVQQ